MKYLYATDVLGVPRTIFIFFGAATLSNSVAEAGIKEEKSVEHLERLSPKFAEKPPEVRLFLEELNYSESVLKVLIHFGKGQKLRIFIKKTPKNVI